MLYNDMACDPWMTLPTLYYLNFSLYGCGYMFKESNLMTRLYESLFWESTIEIQFISQYFVYWKKQSTLNMITTRMLQITTWNIWLI